MTHRFILPVLGLLLAISAWGQHHHVTGNDYDDRPGGGDPNPSAGCTGVQAKVTVSGGGTAFSPATVTIDPGQPVCWTWSGSTEHTVKGDDGAFTSGPPSTSGTFQRTFNTPGTYGYYCQVHGTTTGGMRGTVVVRGNSGGSGAGTLALSSTSYTADEGIGALTVTVERTGGSEGTASVQFETAGGTARSRKDFSVRKGSLSWAAGDQDPKTIEVPIKNDKAKEKDETFTVKLSKANGAELGANIATVTIRDNDGGSGCGSSVASLQARGQSDSEILLTWDAETEVRIERREPEGAFREIAAVDAGTGSFTDFGLPAGMLFEYRLRSAGAVSEIAAAATDGSTAPCDETRALCLGGGRFEAVVERRGGAFATRLPEAPGAGLFSLSRSSSPQLLLEVQDGCAVNGHHWVSIATLADAELTVRIRDTQTGRSWAWHKPAGTLPAPVRDVEAFASCQ